MDPGLDPGSDPGSDPGQVIRPRHPTCPSTVGTVSASRKQVGKCIEVHLLEAVLFVFCRLSKNETPSSPHSSPPSQQSEERSRGKPLPDSGLKRGSHNGRPGFQPARSSPTNRSAWPIACDHARPATQHLSQASTAGSSEVPATHRVRSSPRTRLTRGDSPMGRDAQAQPRTPPPGGATKNASLRIIENPNNKEEHRIDKPRRTPLSR